MDTYHFRKSIHKLPGRVIHAIPIPEPEVTEGHRSRGQIGEICRNRGFMTSSFMSRGCGAV